MECGQFCRLRIIAIALAVVFSSPAAARGDRLEACLAETWLPRHLTCLKDVAIEAGDPALCLQSGELAVRWQCVAFYAEQAGDAAHCMILPDGELEVPGVAGDLCRTHLAIAWRIPALCETLATPNLADACLLKLVELGEDEALCGKIENETLAKACKGP